MNILEDKHVILGITGSIAAYKAVDLASSLTKTGANVDVIMTEASQRFVSSLTFRSVTGRPVYSDMWSLDEHIQHVGIGETADLFMIAPATANTIAKIANGLADNLLTVTALASRCPLLVAPAMDAGMYTHPSTQANVQTLKDRGVQILGPVEGRMASGLIGLGRMVEPKILQKSIRYRLTQNGPLSGVRVLVTAGPTREAIDPVRFLSNRSSGKQGFALAQAALDFGADVTLISGPVDMEPPLGADLINVASAREMANAVWDQADEAAIVLMAAAVADFRPKRSSDSKIKKDDHEGNALHVPMVSNPDILQELGRRRARSGNPQIILGFAAETENLIENAMDKLRRKKIDLIAVNDIGHSDRGFDVDDNRITLLNGEGLLAELPLASKEAIAHQLMTFVLDAHKSQSGAENNG